MKPEFKKKFIIIITLFFLFGCDEKNNNLELEKKAFNDIFISIVDSLYIDFRIPPYPPPPLPEIDKNGKFIFKKQDSLKEKLKREEYFKQKSELKNKLEKDTTRLLIAVYDTIYRIWNRDTKIIRKYFNKNKDSQTDLVDTIEYKIDLSKFRNNSKFIFNYRSKFPKGNKIWESEYNSPFSGTISFSKIYFDKLNSNGILTVSYGCGGLCGGTNRVFIKKEKDKWKIVKMILIAVR